MDRSDEINGHTNNRTPLGTSTEPLLLTVGGEVTAPLRLHHGCIFEAFFIEIFHEARAGPLASTKDITQIRRAVEEVLYMPIKKEGQQVQQIRAAISLPHLAGNQPRLIGVHSRDDGRRIPELGSAKAT